MSEGPITFVRLLPEHLMRIERQPSQAMFLGTEADTTEAEAVQLAQMPEAWTMLVGPADAERIVACFGIAELFTGRHGVAWAVLAPGIGAAHLALTRFARMRLDGTAFRRIDVFAKAPDLEPLLQARSDLDPGQIVAIAMNRQTPEMRWAGLLGFRPGHVLRRYGGADETCMLLERVRHG